MFEFLKRKPQSDLTAELESKRLRNEARFKAQKERMQAEGKHLLQKTFKWTPSDKWAADRGIF